jgi:hypothetical protein
VESPPGERDELLGTKVNIPRPRPDRPARSQLFQRLDEGIGQALILVCARPASARPPCWPTGPPGQAARLPGCRWTRPTTTRRAPGATWSRPWTAPAKASASSSFPADRADAAVGPGCGDRPHQPAGGPARGARPVRGADQREVSTALAGTDDLPDDRLHSDLSTREPQVSMRSCMDTPGKYLQGDRVGHRYASADLLVLCR